MRTFKFGPAPADERFVNDSADPASPRVAHDLVNDSGDAPAAPNGAAPLEGVAGRRASDPAGFRFNLDDALARLSEPHQPIPRFNWSSVTPSATDLAATDLPSTAPATTNPASLQGPMHTTGTGPMAGPPAAAPSPTSTRSMFPDQDSRARPLTQPTLDPLPEIREATQVGPAATSHWSSVPVHAPPPAAALVLEAPPAPAPAAAPMIVTGSDAFAAGVSGFSPDSLYSPTPDVLISRRVGDGLPRLPDSDPAAAPPMAMMTSSTSAASSVRSPSAAKGRKKAKRRGYGKLVLVLMLLAGLCVGALMFGRDYLFPEDWSKDVAPAVDALQLSSGLEFADPVVVNVLPEADYAVKVAGFTFGPTLHAELATSMPRWRALGLVEGEPSAASVNAAVSTWQPAFYDPADGQIYRSATATGPAFDAAMRSALAAALVDQLSPGTPAPAVDATQTASLAQLAVNHFGAELVAGPSQSIPNRTALDSLPVPLTHRLIGVEDLGRPILESLGVVADPAAAVAGFGVDVTTVLDVPWTAAPVPLMLEGDTQDGEAASRGSDFWYTVLAAYLPAETAADAANSISADLYVPALRGAQQCVYGTFTATTPETLGVLQVAAVAWAGLAPAAAGATATTMADGVTVQLSTCDPGTAPNPTRSPDVAAALVARQVARLAPA